MITKGLLWQIIIKEVDSKYDLLMENDKPLGGKWSFDTENRKKLPTSVSLPRKIGVEETTYKRIKTFYK